MNRAKPKSPTRLKIEKMLLDGIEGRIIAKELACSPQIVGNARRALGLPPRKRGRKWGLGKKSQLAEAMFKVLLRSGFTLSQIGTQFGVSKGRISQLIHPEKQHARNQATSALKAGVLKSPQHCEACGMFRKLQMHHQDYSKALDVQWLCQDCHVEADRTVGRFDRPNFAALPAPAVTYQNL